MRDFSRRRGTRIFGGLLLLLTLIAAAVVVPMFDHAAMDAHRRVQARSHAPVGVGGYRYGRSTHPRRTTVYDKVGHRIATLTDGARTVVLDGPERTFSDPDATDATVTTDAWVRIAPAAWRNGGQADEWFLPWLESARAYATTPDILAYATGYMTGPDRAGFGPLIPGQGWRRRTGADFSDYLGTTWKTPGGITVHPDPALYRNVDCSGYVRLVYGYHLGLTLYDDDAPHPDGLPRHARGIAAGAPGVVIADGGARPPSDRTKLQPGDLVFFALHNARDISHMGIYLGQDVQGHDRYLSSRMAANGPTFGDLRGTGTLDGTGYYARRYRIARRI